MSTIAERVRARVWYARRAARAFLSWLMQIVELPSNIRSLRANTTFDGKRVDALRDQVRRLAVMLKVEHDARVKGTPNRSALHYRVRQLIECLISEHGCPGNGCYFYNKGASQHTADCDVRAMLVEFCPLPVIKVGTRGGDDQGRMPVHGSTKMIDGELHYWHDHHWLRDTPKE